jgi:hypothetical protein
MELRYAREYEGLRGLGLSCHDEDAPRIPWKLATPTEPLVEEPRA